MCGVFVVFSKNNLKLDKAKCLKASKEIYNRGPDNFRYNFFKKNTLFICNTVLSITGKQINNTRLNESKDKNYIISFNGEIYNHKTLKQKYLKRSILKSRSDTETLINLYSKIRHSKIPKILNGMFAYVVFDKVKDNLIIVNDSQGEKNLYCYQDENFFIISSNIKPIIKYIEKLKFNYITLNNYFKTRHFMPLDNTCFKKVHLLKNSSNNIFNLSKKFYFQKKYDDPKNWISRIEYSKYKNMPEKKVISIFEKALLDQAKLMIPPINFGCIVSGGIDSTLQARLVNRFKDSNINLTIDHFEKDPIMKEIHKFNRYFVNKIKRLKITKKSYSNLIDNCYKITCSPLQTHDLPSRMLLSQYFKKKKCKVFFSADGCDELFGGQQVYEKAFNQINKSNVNVSPYSTIIKNNVVIKQNQTKKINKELKKSWDEIYSSYKFIKDKRERNIQSSLFLDYFIQSINVGNRSNDLICCENSVEPRNIFIQKNILKIIVNLPLKYKINFLSKEKKFQQKYILKKIFEKNLDHQLIFPKSGFSGFPNEVTINNINWRDKLKNTLRININNKLSLKTIKIRDRNLHWKIINSLKFLKYAKKYL